MKQVTRKIMEQHVDRFFVEYPLSRTSQQTTTNLVIGHDKKNQDKFRRMKLAKSRQNLLTNSEKRGLKMDP